MAHSTHHTDTANESTLLALVEYECISASEHRRASECEWTTTTMDALVKCVETL